MDRMLAWRQSYAAGATCVRQFSGNLVDNGVTRFIVSLALFSERPLEPIAAPSLWREMDKAARHSCLANYRKECVAKSAQTPEGESFPLHHFLAAALSGQADSFGHNKGPGMTRTRS